MKSNWTFYYFDQLIILINELYNLDNLEWFDQLISFIERFDSFEHLDPFDHADIVINFE